MSKALSVSEVYLSQFEGTTVVPVEGWGMANKKILMIRPTDTDSDRIGPFYDPGWDRSGRMFVFTRE